MPIQTALNDPAASSPRAGSGGSLYVAGLGCRQGCSRIELEALLHRALREHGLTITALSCLASSERKADEPGLHELAAHLALPLALLSAAQLAPYDAALSEASPLSKMLTGSAGLAEASALAQADTLSHDKARLLCSKLRSANATCALAVARLS
ncbi:cobalamin biosynthesis protein [Stutzerimonas stutzeri]|uniref:cobalamin biosynthesis protein n=1 Tax=Stutzerimonas stutzeri TaxID=316 RepID=UPI00210BC5FD|nr:cobalamin biosynthesis protein [Stutzerimonas stutzeri]MCQ4257092.1 cobalamin biosynthesis protein [Stutzerimonas stutzeri]